VIESLNLQDYFYDMKNKKLLAASTYLLALPLVLAQATADKGKDLYSQPGANSCQYCHGATGENGSVKNAANLTKPTTWKIYQALGGKSKYTANKAKFLADMKDSTVFLITKGAIMHKATYKKVKIDYNTQMLGVTAAPSKQWIKKNGVTDPVASEAAYLYVQTLDKEGVFK
jgi:hypothetical protein